MNERSPGTTGSVDHPGFERVGVAAVATLVPSLLLVHALAAILPVGSSQGPAAVAVSASVIVVALLHVPLRWRLVRVPAWGWGVVPLVAALVVFARTGATAGAVAVLICGALQGWAQARVAGALPPAIDGRLTRHPWKVAGWSLLALLAVAQTARLASHEADPRIPWWVTTRNLDWTSHLCSSAYFYAADLHDRGEANVYDPAHYPAFDPGAAPRSTVAHLAGHVECAFQYPPPFLLVPWAALRVTKDFHVIRPVWLALQGLGFLSVAVALGVWIGGSRGRWALWLIPAVWIAVPTLQNFQFGQFHLSAVALGVAGMVALESRRTRLGGALLAAAVVTKLYPGVLLVPLVARRRWRDLGATLAWIAAFGILSLVLLGPDLHRAFFFDHLPRLVDGSAFDSPHWDGATRDAMTSIVLSVSSIPARLQLLGTSLASARLGSWLGGALGLGVLALAWWGGRRELDRSQAAILWLALLNLVVLQGQAAFVDYVPATSLWLLTLLSTEMARSRAIAIGLGICWFQLGTLAGTFPFPDEPVGDWTTIVSVGQIAAATLLMTVSVLVLNFWSALRAEPR